MKQSKPIPMFNATKTDLNALCVKFDIKSSSWEQWGLLRSDVHHDNRHCDQKLEKEHLDEAKKKGAFIIDTGDLFCAMQGKYDPRSDKSSCRPGECGMPGVKSGVLYPMVGSPAR